MGTPAASFDRRIKQRPRDVRGADEPASSASPPPASSPQAVSAEMIAGRAYDLFLARGSSDGNDVDDWLAAERELAGRQD